MPLQIFRQTIPGDDSVRVYHSRTQLTSEVQEVAARFENTDNWIMAEILSIPGVVQVAAQPYSLVVFKAMMYNWNEIEPGILRVMASLNIDIENVLRSDET